MGGLVAWVAWPYSAPCLPPLLTLFRPFFSCFLPRPAPRLQDELKDEVRDMAKRLGAATTLKRVALVSCDVDTGAHDAKTLVDAGFVVDAIIPVDLFRGSAEVEVLTLLSRR